MRLNLVTLRLAFLTGMIMLSGGCFKPGEPEGAGMAKVPVVPVVPVVSAVPVVPIINIEIVVPTEMVEVAGGIWWVDFQGNQMKVPSIKIEDKEGKISEYQYVKRSSEKFWMGRREVTWGEWNEVREWGKGKGYEMGKGQGEGEMCPATGVSWYSVVKWCNAKSEKEGLTPVYVVEGAIYREGVKTPEVKAGANGYRLPTEVEWEWAARGGEKGRGCEYSGSNDLGEVGWYEGNSLRKMHAVGEQKANELGIYDLSGNAWEWCFDLWVSTDRVIRGGGWNSAACYARVSSRNADDGTNGHNDLGFRVARSAIP